MWLTSVVQGLCENLLHPIGLVQIGSIGVTFLIALFLAHKIHQFLEKDLEKVSAHIRFTMSPTHFAIILKYVFWMLFVWFCEVLFKKFTIPTGLLPTAFNLIFVLLVIRFASFYIKSTFWTRFVYVICVIVAFLRISKLWDPTVQLLNSMTIGLGKISISVWGLTEAIVVFILLWAVAITANRFIAHWLISYSHLTYSDRTLLQRVIKAAAVGTDPALHPTGRIRWGGWQPKFPLALPVNLCRNFQHLLRLPANACQAEAQDFRDLC
jgi:small-conductance mechanosensitive channel